MLRERAVALAFGLALATSLQAAWRPDADGGAIGTTTTEPVGAWDLILLGGAALPPTATPPGPSLAPPPVMAPWEPPPPAPPPPSVGPVPLRLGTDLEGLRALRAQGLAPDYVVLWAGAWNWKGWDDLRAALLEVREAGAVPMVHWYYWGEDISPGHVEAGVVSQLHGAYKSKVWWTFLAWQLAGLLNETLEGREALVVLESEFNKHGIETYEPFDGYLAEQAAIFRGKAPEARLVLGLGNWGLPRWAHWDRAAGAVDYVGFQTLVAGTRADVPGYEQAAASVLAAAEAANRTFGKPSLLVDLALSSFESHEAAQALALEAVLGQAQGLRDAGLMGVVYRAWRDTPSMGEHLWFGAAEKHWGLVDHLGQPKPALDVWLAGLRARL